MNNNNNKSNPSLHLNQINSGSQVSERRRRRVLLYSQRSLNQLVQGGKLIFAKPTTSYELRILIRIRTSSTIEIHFDAVGKPRSRAAPSESEAAARETYTYISVSLYIYTSTNSQIRERERL